MAITSLSKSHIKRRGTGVQREERRDFWAVFLVRDARRPLLKWLAGDYPHV
jgi:hypothetical protein